MIKISIIIPFYGPFPDYLNYFLLCTSYNSKIDWLIFTDQEKPAFCPKNVIYYHLSIDSFNKLTTSKLGFNIEINNPYKLCDLKPTYGLIFEDFIKEYDFWGYSDIDLFLGNIVKFITPNKLNETDILSTYDSFISGSFCLFRNSGKINTLFRLNRDFASILLDQKYIGFDENIKRKEIQGLSLKKLVYFILFILQSVIKFNFYSFSFSEFRYQFQWYYKKISVQKGVPLDMTEIVFSNSKLLKLKSLFLPIMLSDSYFNRISIKKWNIYWNNGRLYNKNSGKEIFGFHFRESKKDIKFVVQPFNPSVASFSISKTGIRNEK